MQPRSEPSSNGVAQPSAANAHRDMLQQARNRAWTREYANVLEERETLLIRHRVQKRLKAEPALLDELTTALERCETALSELGAMGREWGFAVPDDQVV